MSPAAGTPRKLVLMVEDDPDDARVVVVGLEAEHDITVVHVRTGAEAMQALETSSPSAILIDHRLPDMTGVTLIQRIREKGYQGPLIMVSGVREDRIVASALAAGANDFLVKDLEFGDEIADRLRSVVEI